MSENENVLNNSNSSFTNYDVSKIFIGENRYQKDSYINNSTYDPIHLKAGTAMGRIGATDIVAPFTSNASDGSQNIIGFLAHDIDVDSGDTVNCTIVDAGDVVKSKVIFVKPGDGMDTVISGRRVKDLIQATTLCKLVVSNEMTDYDNQP